MGSGDFAFRVRLLSRRIGRSGDSLVVNYALSSSAQAFANPPGFDAIVLGPRRFGNIPRLADVRGFYDLIKMDQQIKPCIW